MTLTLELPPEMEEAVQEEAARQGVQPMDFALSAVLFYLAFLDVLNQRTGRLNRSNLIDDIAVAAPPGEGETESAKEALLQNARKVERALQEKLALHNPDRPLDIAQAHLANHSNSKVAPGLLSDEEVAARVAAVRSTGVYDTRVAAGLPPLTDEDISRETIYGERGL